MNFKRYHVSANLIDADSYYGEYKSGNSYTATALQFNNKKIYPFNAADIGKKFTISCEITNLSSTNVRWQAVTGGETTDGVARSSVGVIQLTFTVVSIDDYIRVTYGSGNALMTITNVMLNSGNTSLPYEPYGNTWHDIPHYIHNTSTDIITTLPAVIYPTDTTATVGLKGQTLQSSIPSPTSPVMPQGTGDKTANLFDKSKRTDNSRVVYTTGEISALSGIFVSDFTPIEPNTTYTLNIVSSISGKTGHLFALYDENKNFVNTGAHEALSATVVYTFTTPSNVAYIRFNGNMSSVDKIMLNTGSTALPYEPWGIKIPILSGGVTTPIYLSEPLRKIGDYADTIGADGTITRNVGVYKMRGTESWLLYGGNYFTNYFDSRAKMAYKCICTHLIGDTSLSGGGIWIGSDAYKTKVFSTAVSGVSSDLDTFKSYLADQYSAGTPVTVWYVLATPTTEQITMPTIPVTAGANTLSVDTTLQPSEVTVNYKGWHPVADVHERESGQWD